ncbi:MAG: hypothetical protein NW206_14965 [Hyphomonadaceae bacterium]|nr:hypothetical protein [Hyphomonadaceae bacterium]
MRTLLFAALATAALAGHAYAEGRDSFGPNPFPVERGSALPPPGGDDGAGGAAPPQGAGPGGIDFGQWRGAEPVAYGQGFRIQLRDRFAGQDRGAIRADLERNGFACQDGEQLHCRIEIMDAQCAVDWYVVYERAASEPIAGFDRMCLTR